MKGKLLIIFQSSHGYVKRYVDIIGNAVGCDAVPANKLRGNMLSGYDKFLLIGSVHNDEVMGIKKIAEYYDIIYKKLIVCGVGMVPFRSDIPARLKDVSISVMYEKFIPVFYAQGGFDMKELTRTENMAIALRVRQIRRSNIVNDDDKFLLDAVETPVDEVKLANIQPLIDYLEGRQVDEKLYSPPEITDEAGEKEFFAEFEKAMGAPMDKKRALKKQLKKGKFKMPVKPEEEPESEGEGDSAPADEPTDGDRAAEAPVEDESKTE